MHCYLTGNLDKEDVVQPFYLLTCM